MLSLQITTDNPSAEGVDADEGVDDTTVKVVDIVDTFRLQAGLEDGCDRSIGNLLYLVATKFPNNALKHHPTLLGYITSGKVKSIPQVEAAFGFLSKVGPQPYDSVDVEKACGVGVEVPLGEIKNAVESVLKKNKDRILEQRYHVKGLV